MFDELVSRVTPDKALIAEATASPNPQYKQALEKRAQHLGITPDLVSWELWKLYTRKHLETSSSRVYRQITTGDVGTGFDDLHNGYQCDASQVELMACLPERWRLPEDYEDDSAELDYAEWPPREECA